MTDRDPPGGDRPLADSELPGGDRPLAGLVAADVAAELPGLRLRWLTARARPGPSPPALIRRLRELSNRYRGINVVTMRTEPIPHAYRSFFRQIGLDPDVDRIPGERAAVQRLLHGGFRSVDRVSDACLVALIETGVAVWALDAAALAPGGLEIRLAGSPAAEAPPRADCGAGVVPRGSLVVADPRSVHALLFSDPLPAGAVGPGTIVVTLFSIGVPGVPEIHLEEALWLAAEQL